MTARLYARVTGSFLVLFGVAGLFSGEVPLFGVLNVDPFESLLHLVSGFVLLYAGFVPRGEHLAGVASLVVGIIYALVGVIGMVVPDLFGLTPGGLSLADDLVHLTLGVLGISSAELSRHDAPPAGDVRRSTVGYAAGACLIGGPVLGLLTGGAGFGVLVFCAGIVLFGARTLMGGKDRAVGWAIVFVGVLAAIADLTRLLLGFG